LRSISLFTPGETHDCPYLDDRQALSQYVDPRLELNEFELSTLSRLGFRRSGKLLYRPACPGCMECLPVRLPVNEFVLSKNMKRLVKRSQSWTLQVVEPNDADRYYDLYERYITERHRDGDMFPPSRKTFSEFLAEDFGNTRFLTATEGDELVGVLVFDQFDDGLSSVYCFYAPEREKDSIGTTLIIRLSQLTKSLGLPYNYLGYYVNGCRKMDYKTRFKPIEVLQSGSWHPLKD
jgi:arginyl-tRNA--protein-N-Asp/Glu arginylyltransferase